MYEFKNKIALITGGSKGIGFATAKKLSAHGVIVIITGRNVEDLISSSKKISQEGSECFYYVCELGNKSDIENTQDKDSIFYCNIISIYIIYFFNILRKLSLFPNPFINAGSML